LPIPTLPRTHGHRNSSNAHARHVHGGICEGGKVSNWGKIEVRLSHFSNSPTYVILFERPFIVDLRINETLQTGAVGNRTYRVGLNAVRLGNRTYRGTKVSIYF
jgi:hypothetical protein